MSSPQHLPGPAGVQPRFSAKSLPQVRHDVNMGESGPPLSRPQKRRKRLQTLAAHLALETSKHVSVEDIPDVPLQGVGAMELVAARFANIERLLMDMHGAMFFCWHAGLSHEGTDNAFVPAEFPQAPTTFSFNTAAQSFYPPASPHCDVQEVIEVMESGARDSDIVEKCPEIVNTEAKLGDAESIVELPSPGASHLQTEVPEGPDDSKIAVVAPGFRMVIGSDCDGATKRTAMLEEEPSVDDFHDCETSDGKWMSSEDIESMCRDMSIRSASATAEAILEQTKETILQLQCQRDEYHYEVGSLNVSLNERDELLEECDQKKN